MGVYDYARNWLRTGSMLTIPMRFYSKGKLHKGGMNISYHVIEIGMPALLSAERLSSLPNLSQRPITPIVCGLNIPAAEKFMTAEPPYTTDFDLEVNRKNEAGYMPLTKFYTFR